MSDPIVIINQNKPIEKRRPGRPRKLKEIPHAKPTIQQQFRIFTNITQPYLEQISDIPEKDFMDQIKEIEYNNKTADEKALSSFSQLNVRTDNFIDQIALNKYNNDRKNQQKEARQARLKLKAERKQLAVDNKLKKDILKNKQDISSKKEQEILASSVNYKAIPKGTINGKAPRFEYKNIADPVVKVTTDRAGVQTKSKTSQGNDRQTVNKTGNISYQGTKAAQYRTPTVREINKADVKRKEYKLATPSKRVVKTTRARDINSP